MRITLLGKMGVGKTTVANLLAAEKDMQVISIGATIKPIANLLITDPTIFQKEMLSILPSSPNTKESIHSVITYFEDNFKNAIWEKDGNGGYLKNKDYRRLLQFYPSLFRQHFGEDIFLKYTLNKISLEDGESYIIDDMRLEGEKRLLEELGFLTIRLDVQREIQKERLLKHYGYVDEEALSHPTETALDSATFHHRVDTSYLTPEEVVNDIQKHLMAL